MSGEAFETIMSCDMATAPDGRSVLGAQRAGRVGAVDASGVLVTP